MPLVDPIYDEIWKDRYKASQRTCNKHVVALKKAEAERQKAEHAFRELGRDRDHWKQRAVIAEAALKSLGAK